MLSRRNKAVAVGAVSYYIDHFVTARILKFTYGVECDTRYRPSDPESVERWGKSFVNAMEERRVPGAFKTMLTRVRHAQSSLGVSDLISSLCRALRF